MRVLAVDYGQKRVGLAISDETATVAQPIGYVAGGSHEAVGREILRIAAERGAAQIVVGVPVRLNGQPSEQTQRTLAFVNVLRSLSPLPIQRWDERLTSVQAERALLEGNVRRKERREKIDAMAAQLMLQNFLDAKNPPPNPEED
jgi:putative Holliday junction resolvase